MLLFPTCPAVPSSLIISRLAHESCTITFGFLSRPVLIVAVGMSLKQKIRGGLLAFIGYMLSPLSWWNDMFVNVPLALVFAWIVSAFYRPAFSPSLVIGYWLTNVLGFVLMHKGAQTALANQDRKYSRRDLVKDLTISLLYTLLIVGLVKCGVLKPVQGYFAEH